MRLTISPIPGYEDFEMFYEDGKLNVINKKYIEERDKRVRAEAIEDCMRILRSHHMLRTCEDDYIQNIEFPFYTRLWKRFETLKEQRWLNI